MNSPFDNASARIELYDMRELPRGWDSYAACTIDERAIKKALELLNVLPAEWQAVPCKDGSVQLEQHRDGFDIEIRIALSASAHISEK